MVCDDGEVSAHKLVLFTGIEFFKSFLPQVKHPNPYIYLRGIKMKHLEMALNFMYLGTVQVPQDDIGAILDVANDLKISGLTEEETPGVKQKKDQLKKKEIEETRNTANIVENDKSRSKRYVKNNHVKERRKRNNVTASDVELNFSSVFESM